jgi:hypothetical protein
VGEEGGFEGVKKGRSGGDVCDEWIDGWMEYNDTLIFLISTFSFLAALVQGDMWWGVGSSYTRFGHRAADALVSST